MVYPCRLRRSVCGVADMSTDIEDEFAVMQTKVKVTARTALDPPLTSVGVDVVSSCLVQYAQYAVRADHDCYAGS